MGDTKITAATTAPYDDMLKLWLKELENDELQEADEGLLKQFQALVRAIVPSPPQPGSMRRAVIETFRANARYLYEDYLQLRARKIWHCAVVARDVVPEILLYSFERPLRAGLLAFTAQLRDPTLDTQRGGGTSADHALPAETSLESDSAPAGSGPPGVPPSPGGAEIPRKSPAPVVDSMAPPGGDPSYAYEDDLDYKYDLPEGAEVLTPAAEAPENTSVPAEAVATSAPGPASPPEDPGLVLIRFRRDCSAIVGIDLKEYGPFQAEDVVFLPEPNARVFVTREYAEHIELEPATSQ